ncbi:hypothetical protein [Polynucleobacter kasalickyi]|uniref:6-phosphogluconate dehydrogenase n=1 Tax=Polynucleobacter kasalickyi TaxID=1938817 RepID=A0A1W2AX52_9BURK|nr:hypothetical protein [Polynucleobacter kasalickyi]SMC65289.1 hypothetical protein SAMN06296008_110137 [Polynucleobacter kasalickyi]
MTAKSIQLKLFMFLMVAVGLFALYTWLTLTYTYSEGSRAGFLQKFSKRGWVCKTWEGEIVTGSMLGNQEKFLFSVRDPELAKELNAAIGKRVEVDYSQHIGVPSNCFGETEYFLKSIKTVPESITFQRDVQNSTNELPKETSIDNIKK